MSTNRLFPSQYGKLINRGVHDPEETYKDSTYFDNVILSLK